MIRLPLPLPLLLPLLLLALLPVAASAASPGKACDDARTQLLALEKLAIGRNRYAVSNELTLAWFNRERAPTERLHALGELSNDLIACIVRDEPDVPTQALLRAMVQMKQDGEFDAIIARYR